MFNSICILWWLPFPIKHPELLFLAGLFVALLHVAEVVSEVLDDWRRETFFLLCIHVVDQRTWRHADLWAVKLKRRYNHFDRTGEVVALSLGLVKLFCLELLLHTWDQHGVEDLRAAVWNMWFILWLFLGLRRLVLLGVALLALLTSLRADLLLLASEQLNILVGIVSGAAFRRLVEVLDVSWRVRMTWRIRAGVFARQGLFGSNTEDSFLLLRCWGPSSAGWWWSHCGLDLVNCLWRIFSFHRHVSPTWASCSLKDHFILLLDFFCVFKLRYFSDFWLEYFHLRTVLIKFSLVNFFFARDLFFRRFWSLVLETSSLTWRGNECGSLHIQRRLNICWSLY